MPVTRPIALARSLSCVTLVTSALVMHAASTNAQNVAVVPPTQNALPGARNGAGVDSVALETVDVSTLDRRGVIRVDGRIVGECDFRGRLPVGSHVIAIARPGYDPFERTIMLRAGAPFMELVSLTPSLVVRSPGGSGEAMRGVYGGFLLNASFEPGGLNSQICSFQGVTHCSVSSPVGGGLFGTFGYMMDPIGLDVLFGVQADAASVTATAEGQTATAVIPRIGGLLAGRARLAWQSSAARLTVAAGVGAALRSIGLVAAGLDTATYFAPALTLEAAAHVRVARTTAISLGLLFWGENAGHGEQLQVKPLTSSVVVTRSTQAFFLPFVGMVIGP